MKRIYTLGLVAVLLLARTAAVSASQVFTLTTESFDDANGNGLIDCGETVNIQVALYDNAPPVGVPFSGHLTIPSDFPNHFSYASFEEDFQFTNRCQITNVSSLGRIAVDYSCTGEVAPNNGYTLALHLHGAYTGPSGAIQFQGTNDTTSPTVSTVTANYLETRTKACAQADLQLTKSDGGISSAPGKTVPYALTVVNRGNSQAAGTVLSETVPAYTSFNAASSSSGWVCTPNNLAGSTCTASVGNLVLGGSASRVFAVDVGTNVPPGVTLISNTATVTSNVADANPADNTATDTTPLAPGVPDLSLRKTTSSTGALPGSTVTWTLAVTNSGNAQADNVAISETLPAGTAFVAGLSSAGWSCSGSPCTLSLGSLAAGASVSRQFAVRIPTPAPASLVSITNTACASTTTANEPAGNNCGSTTTSVGGSPRIQINKSVASGSATPGASLVWALTVTNTGDRDAGAVTVHETVPAGTTFDAAGSGAAGISWSCPSPAAGSLCTLTLPSLAGGGGSASLSFATRVANPLPAGVTSIDNTACATTSGSADACTTVSVPSDGSPNPTVVKRLVSGNGAPGSVLVFGLTVQNSGNQDAVNVTLNETVPDNTSWVALQSSPDWSCSGTEATSSCSLTIPSLPGGGGSVSRTFAVRVDNPLAAGVTSLANTACVSSGVPGKVRPRPKSNGGPCDTVVVTPAAAPVLAIQKALTGGTPGAGQTVVYTLSVSNTGNQNAGNVTLTDAVPAGTTFVAGGGWACSPTSRAPSSCSLAVGSLAAGASLTREISFLLDSAVPAGQTALQNQACASDGSRRACASTNDPILPSGSPALEIRKTYTGGPLVAGALLPFHLLVSNHGTAAATGFKIQETVPSGVVFSAADSDSAWVCAGTGPGSACTLPIATLAAGASRDVVFAVRAPNPLPPNLRQVANSACLLDSGGSSTGCDTTSTPLDVAVYVSLDDALLVDRNHDGFLSTGDTLRYTLVVKNTTGQAASALKITTALDRHVALVVGSVVTSAGTVSSGNHAGDTSPMVLLPTLAPGDSFTVTFDVLAQDLSGLLVISSQSLAVGSNFQDQLSDDPETPEPADPTRTPLSGIAPAPIPTVGLAGMVLLGVLLSAVAVYRLRRPARPRNLKTA